jgi:hypothetical protein
MKNTVFSVPFLRKAEQAVKYNILIIKYLKIQLNQKAEEVKP